MIWRIVIMGVAGCGKSSVGAGLSQRLGIPYFDGDDLHPAANVEKMRAGTPLTDEDRWPWLQTVGKRLHEDAPVIIGCSALKRSYRDLIRSGAKGPVTFVHLVGSRDLIADRMAQRQGHYMPLALLDSQFAALEPPGPQEAMAISIDQTLPQMLDGILEALETTT
jgi:gluconokinase